MKHSEALEYLARYLRALDTDEDMVDIAERAAAELDRLEGYAENLYNQSRDLEARNNHLASKVLHEALKQPPPPIYIKCERECPLRGLGKK